MEYSYIKGDISLQVRQVMKTAQHQSAQQQLHFNNYSSQPDSREMIVGNKVSSATRRLLNYHQRYTINSSYSPSISIPTRSIPFQPKKNSNPSHFQSNQFQSELFPTRPVPTSGSFPIQINFHPNFCKGVYFARSVIFPRVTLLHKSYFIFF